jgi:hypothetical protein
VQQRNLNSSVLKDCRLLRCVMDFQSSLQCSEPRDRVFGILALVKECSVGDIKVDYSRSVVDVYTDALCHIYRWYRSLDFLCSVEIPGKDHHTLHGLLSWVLDWTRPIHSNFYQSFKEYGASGTIPPLSNPFSKDRRILNVQGMKVVSVLKSIRRKRERKSIARYLLA